MEDFWTAGATFYFAERKRKKSFALKEKVTPCSSAFAPSLYSVVCVYIYLRPLRNNVGDRSGTLSSRRPHSLKKNKTQKKSRKALEQNLNPHEKIHPIYHETKWTSTYEMWKKKKKHIGETRRRFVQWFTHVDKNESFNKSLHFILCWVYI